MRDEPIGNCVRCGLVVDPASASAVARVMQKHDAPGQCIDALLAQREANAAARQNTIYFLGLARDAELSHRLDREHAKDRADVLERLATELKALRVTLGYDSPWPVADVLRKFVEAHEHMRGHHGCDCVDYEDVTAAVDAARRMLEAL